MLRSLACLIAGVLAASGPLAAESASQPASRHAGPVKRWLTRAQDDVGSIASLRDQTELSWEIVRLYLRANDAASAKAAAAAIAARPNRWYYEQLQISELVGQGRFTEARAIAADIGNSSERSPALIEIIQGLALGGKVPEASALADQFTNARWLAEAYGEIAGAQARNGEFAAAVGTAEGAAVKPIRDRVLMALADMQALANDPAGAKATAARIKDAIRRDMVLSAIDDAHSEAAFARQWASMPTARGWPVPPSRALEQGFRGLLLDALTAALSAKPTATQPAWQTDAYNTAIRNAAAVTATIVQPPRLDRNGRPVPYDPSTDPTLIQRGLGYTFIAVVEAVMGDLAGARALTERAIATGEQNAKDDVFTGTCGPILAVTRIKIGQVDEAIEYAVRLQKGHALGGNVARAIGYALAEQNKLEALEGYIRKLTSPAHRVNVFLGAAAFYAKPAKGA